MGRKMIDLTGRQFGMLTVLNFSHDQNKWMCQCGCGGTKFVPRQQLTGHKTKSCGCLGGGRTTNDQPFSLARKPPLKSRWQGMINRCEDPQNDNYKNYGAKGVSVCERWHQFRLFFEDMGPTFFEGATLDRIDNNGIYEPSNVRWATRIEQNANRSYTVYLDTPWGRMTRADTARKIGITYYQLVHRLKAWTIEDIIRKHLAA